VAESTLRIRFISHGTLECRDIAFTRRFYEEFFGFEVVQTSKVSIWLRLGGQHSYACIQTGHKTPMDMFGHNGLDVETDERVDECYQLVLRDAELWKLHKISKPQHQHGSYSFYFWDADDNCWEILSNPPGGYSWMFERGDQKGRGFFSRDFVRPELKPTESQSDPPAKPEG